MFPLFFEDANVYIVEMRIKVKNGCPTIEELLTGILSDFVWKLDYAYFSSKLDDFHTLSITCHNYLSENYGWDRKIRKI